MYINHEEAYKSMLRQTRYLTDREGPLVYAGLIMAQTLDKQDTPSTNLLNEYSRTVRYLISLAPQGTMEDELTDFLKANMK